MPRGCPREAIQSKGPLEGLDRHFARRRGTESDRARPPSPMTSTPCFPRAVWRLQGSRRRPTRHMHLSPTAPRPPLVGSDRSPATSLWSGRNLRTGELGATRGRMPQRLEPGEAGRVPTSGSLAQIQEWQGRDRGEPTGHAGCVHRSAVRRWDIQARPSSRVYVRELESN